MKYLNIATTVFALLLSGQSFAFCQLEATDGAPAIPSAEGSNYAEVQSLGIEVQQYINTASAKLAKCKDASEGFLHNIAVLELEQTAERYNKLAHTYRQSVAGIE